ncbi:hypothetical protein [Paraburkholderia sp. BCC1886]|uniref:hypothetical protein n=1 Tax=Paraburkholderia sp. BCC1886 TaxID=2562670 RepID=UPI001182AB37|nr:hypothetical protein [Paraburkholderia sp. BCC1886]
MPTKQKGKCPFCNQAVTPEIVEENTVRRDKLKCPECSEPLYVCRTPGCHDFAKGTAVYDHELCPDCTETAGNVAAEVGKAALKVGTTIATAVFTTLVLAKGKK